MSIYRGRYFSASGCDGGARPGTNALMSWYLGAYADRGAANLGTYACKRLGSGWSIHAERRAADLGTAPYGGVDSTWGWALANALRLDSAELGVQLIILGRRVWSCTQPDAGWRSYGGEYHGHAHVELTPSAADSLTAAEIERRIGGGGGTTVPVPSGSPLLRREPMSTGGRVRQLQVALNEAAGAGLKVDGDYGPKTEAAVEAFQRAAGLGVDGIYGPNTAAALRQALEDDMDLIGTRVKMADDKGKRWSFGEILGKDSITANAALGYSAAGGWQVRTEVVPMLRALTAAVAGQDVADTVQQLLAEDAERERAERAAELGEVTEALQRAAQERAEIAELVAQVGSGERDAQAVVDEIARRLKPAAPSPADDQG